MNKRLTRLWQFISNYKIPEHLSARERNPYIVSNQASFLGLLSSLLIGFSLLGGWVILLFFDYSKYVSYIYAGLPFALNFLIELILFKNQRKFRNLQIFAAVIGSFVSLNFLLSSIFFGSAFNLDIILLAVAGAGIYIFWHHKVWLIIIFVAAPLGLISTKIYHLFFTPIFPIEVKSLHIFFSLTSTLGLAFGIMLIFYFVTSQSVNFENALYIEKDLSDKLLRNILPDEIAFELKSKNSVEPKIFPSATVMFTDFVGFTRIAESLTPQELIGELDKCFSYFDQVVGKYKLEKLKTIGDSFMCAGGLPVSNNTHMFDCAMAALEIQAFMRQMKMIKAKQRLPYWELRLGIHSGPLVAGVIGERKFAYDVWGDTVNVASRMESSGTAGEINISKTTYEQLRWVFECEHRGAVKAKNKGEIDMYYLKRIKTRFSRDNEGRIPNDEFMKIYAALEQGGRFVAKTS